MHQPQTAFLVRAYSKNEEGVEEVVNRTILTALKISQLSIKCSLMVAVPSEKDCGLTADRIRSSAKERLLEIGVFEFDGHPSKEVLNSAIIKLAQKGVQYVGIVSNKSREYVSDKVLDSAFDARSRGAFAAGVVVSEFQEMIRSGLLLNTFCFWDVSKLMSVGLFDSGTGVEEVSALVRLARKYGSGISVIETSGSEKLQIDAVRAAEYMERVVKTKEVRQESELKRVGANRSEIEDSILP